MAKAFGPHTLGQAIDQPLADLPGRLGGHIAGGKSCASSGNDQAGRSGMKAKARGDRFDLVGQGCRLDRGYPRGLECSPNGRARQIGLFAPEAAVADGQDDSVEVGWEAWGHPV